MSPSRNLQPPFDLSARRKVELRTSTFAPWSGVLRARARSMRWAVVLVENVERLSEAAFEVRSA